MRRRTSASTTGRRTATGSRRPSSSPVGAAPSSPGPFWTAAGPAQRPAVVITTGSVQAPETLYWGLAAALAKAGYVVLTYDVQGQGAFGAPSAEAPDTQEGVPSQAGHPSSTGPRTRSTSCSPHRVSHTTRARAAETRTAGRHRPLAQSASTASERAARPPSTPSTPWWTPTTGSESPATRSGRAPCRWSASPTPGRRRRRLRQPRATSPMRRRRHPGRRRRRVPSPRPPPATPLPTPSPARISKTTGLTPTPSRQPHPQEKNAAFLDYSAQNVRDSMEVSIKGGTHYKIDRSSPQHRAHPRHQQLPRPGPAHLVHAGLARQVREEWDRRRRRAPASPPLADDPLSQDVNTNDDPNMYSFYFRSRYDFYDPGGPAVCADMRTGCAGSQPTRCPEPLRRRHEHRRPGAAPGRADGDSDGVPTPATRARRWPGPMRKAARPRQPGGPTARLGAGRPRPQRVRRGHARSAAPSDRLNDSDADVILGLHGETAEQPAAGTTSSAGPGATDRRSRRERTS